MENDSKDDCRCHELGAWSDDCEKHRGYVRATVRRAGDIDAHGESIGEDVLRMLHDGERLFYDVAQRLLYWFGPHHELPGPHPFKNRITVPSVVSVSVGTCPPPK